MTLSNSSVEQAIKLNSLFVLKFRIKKSEHEEVKLDISLYICLY